MNTQIEKFHYELTCHEMYNKMTSIENIQIFMKYHVFAVWDFMSLLKSLQKKITCTTIPWQESKHNPEIVRLINEIVLGEESDVDYNGKASSHFSLYLRAMQEIGADTSLINDYLGTMNLNLLPSTIREFLSFHLDIALNGSAHQVASSFFYGREKLIPSMFESITKVLEKHQLNCPTLIYYFRRHIEVDGEEHGPMALKCLNILADTNEKKMQSIEVAKESLLKRHQLWDFINKEISKS